MMASKPDKPSTPTVKKRTNLMSKTRQEESMHERQNVNRARMRLSLQPREASNDSLTNVANKRKSLPPSSVAVPSPKPKPKTVAQKRYTAGTSATNVKSTVTGKDEKVGSPKNMNFPRFQKPIAGAVFKKNIAATPEKVIDLRGDSKSKKSSPLMTSSVRKGAASQSSSPASSSPDTRRNLKTITSSSKTTNRNGKTFAPGSSSDTSRNSSNASSGAKPSLVKTKSRRRPTRHATYVSELDKSVREKFRAQTPRNITSNEQHQVKSNIMNCPIHSRYINRTLLQGNRQPSKKAPISNNTPDSKKSSTAKSSIDSKYRTVTRHVQSIENRVNNTNRASNTSTTSKSVPYFSFSPALKQNKSNNIPSVNKATRSRIASTPRAPVNNSRPSTTPNRASAVNSNRNTTQSYLVRNNMIPKTSQNSTRPTSGSKKVRQKSFKLLRVKSISKSFKNKKKPSVKKLTSPVVVQIEPESKFESKSNVPQEDAPRLERQDTADSVSDMIAKYEADVDGDEDSDDEDDAVKIAKHYYQLFQEQFPEKVAEYQLTVEELVGIKNPICFYFLEISLFIGIPSFS